MKISFITPTLELLRVASLTTYRMCLAPRLSDAPYRYYFAYQCSGATVLFDNGAFELGAPLDNDTLLRAYTSLAPHFPEVFVLPDVLHSYWKEEFSVSYNYLVPKVLRLNPDVEFMAVPHSLDNLESLAAEVAWYRTFLHVDVIGLNKSVEILPGGRVGAIKALGTWSYHLLGCRRDPIGEVFAVIEAGLTPQVRGMDSSLPYRLASMGRALTEISPSPPYCDDKAGVMIAGVSGFALKELKQYAHWIESAG